MEHMEVSKAFYSTIIDVSNTSQHETMPDLASIEIQTEIQWFMRPYLLDFLLEAHHAFQLLPETLHLAVNLLDRYCSRRVVYKRHYQLVGCAALLIAAKYGDRKERVPTIRELKSMCCALYDDDMFTQMEWHVLQTLNWIIGHPTVTSFVDLALTEVAFDPELQHMTLYLTELALYHKEFIPVRPSMMARSALGLARCILNRPQPRYNAWTAQYDSQVVLNLSSHLVGPSPALARKYASPALSSASTTIELFLARQAALAQQQQQQQQQRPVQTPQPEMQVGHQVNSYGNQLLTPQTPHGHKIGYQQIPLGVLTPPITPDKDQNPQNFGVNPGMAAIRAPPQAHTPPPSAEYHPQQQQTYYPPHQHMMPMPQPVQ